MTNTNRTARITGLAYLGLVLEAVPAGQPRRSRLDRGPRAGERRGDPRGDGVLGVAYALTVPATAGELWMVGFLLVSGVTDPTAAAGRPAALPETTPA